MKFMEETLQTRVGNAYDVIVAGGGPSGCAAAIAAARAGSRVLLVENQGCLGGMWTAGFVNPLFDNKNKGGLLAEWIEDLKSHGAWGGFWDISFHYEYMKELLERKCLEAGVTVLLDTRYTGVKTEGNRVCGVFTDSIDGRVYYPAGVVVDATGDAAVAADAGAEWVLGDDNQSCQAMTLMFLVGNIPEKYRDGLNLHDVLFRAYERQGQNRKMPFEKPFLIPVPNADFGVVQLTHMRGFSPLSAEQRSLALVEGRKQVLEIFELLREYDEDFKSLMLLQTAPLLGVRESRRIVGEYCLTEEDLMNGAQFEDGITTATFGIDIHDADSTNQTCRGVKPYQIPYRCLIPRGIEGLLVAGKTISGTHVAMASYRVTGDCCAMGEAAGKAASYAVLNHVSVREVPVTKII